MTTSQAPSVQSSTNDPTYDPASNGKKILVLNASPGPVTIYTDAGKMMATVVPPRHQAWLNGSKILQPTDAERQAAGNKIRVLRTFPATPAK